MIVCLRLSLQLITQSAPRSLPAAVTAESSILLAIYKPSNRIAHRQHISDTPPLRMAHTQIAVEIQEHSCRGAAASTSIRERAPSTAPPGGTTAGAGGALDTEEAFELHTCMRARPEMHYYYNYYQQAGQAQWQAWWGVMGRRGIKNYGSML